MEHKKTQISKYTYPVILGILYVLPIILANRYYNDDTQRVLNHFPGWSLDGRPLTDLLMKFMCGANNYVYDIFPLPLLISVVMLTVVALKWIEKYHDPGIAITTIVSFLPLSMTLFLTNLSYRFDCASMTLSVAVLVLPFIIDLEKPWKQCAFDSLCILVSMCFYQPTVGLFIGLLVTAAFTKCLTGENPVRRSLSACISIVISAGLYKFAVAPIFVDKEGWRSNAGNLISLTSAPQTIISHYKDTSLIIIDYLKTIGMRQILVYAVIWMLGGVAVFYATNGKTTAKRLGITLFYCILPVMVFVLSILPVSFLNSFNSQSRFYISLISMMFVLATELALISRKWPRLAIVLGALVVIFRFSFSYAYGNTLRAQKEYSDQMVGHIVNDIEDLNAEIITEITIIGDPPSSPVAKSTVDLMPIMKEMIPPTLDDGETHNGALINHHAISPLTIVAADDEDNNFIDLAKPSSENLIYSLYNNENRVYVCFK